jgi:hypothetical protein
MYHQFGDQRVSMKTAAQSGSLSLSQQAAGDMVNRWILRTGARNDVNAA